MSEVTIPWGFGLFCVSTFGTVWLPLVMLPSFLAGIASTRKGSSSLAFTLSWVSRAVSFVYLFDNASLFMTTAIIVETILVGLWYYDDED